MFYSLEEMAVQAQNEYNGSIASLMIAKEQELNGRTREEILKQMEKNLEVMTSSVEEGVKGVKSVTGLTGGDAAKLDHYLKSGKSLSSATLLTSVKNAIAVSEVNAKMGLICATPTAGSAGCLPAVLSTAIKKLNLGHKAQLDFLFVAGAVGLVIANNASISGAEGGCQAEVGTASAMASAALVQASGGEAEVAIHAAAMVLKNMLGLICDPVAGLVEIPCIKRNALGASQAFVSADMALAGIKSVIPPDEVVTCMYQVGLSLPSAFRETSEGGLAQTPTGKRLMQEIFKN
ncbi:MAG: L-serine ammonia-lyase, iron-sulfur-dependent, subunit alpha [Lactobacillales bacterium]|jgi:L-serine dehydratase|nr:L-serine ammonia-lyase, iron-sulfur-dependent, subunit alpha [Lactobacillales bacterium]